MHEYLVKGVHLFAVAYLFLIGVIYPFYMKNGYSELGANKFLFYKNITIAMLGIVLPLAIAAVITRDRAKQIYLISSKNITSTDFFVLLNGLLIIVSYAMSDYQKQALWGADGWFMGCLTQLLILLTYFVIAKGYRYHTSAWWIFLTGSAGVFLLGILNRFSIYLLPIEVRSADFISTLGNINWFSGYWAVLYPIGVCLYIFGQRRLCRLFAGIYMIIAFMAGLTQGSSSAFLSLAAVFYILFLIVLDKGVYFKRYLETGMLWGISCGLVWLFRRWDPERYNYETRNLCGYVTGSTGWLWIFLFLLIAFCLVKRFILCKSNNEMDETTDAHYSKWLKYSRVFWLVCPMVCIGSYVIILAFNTWMPGGIWGLQDNSHFLFNEEWGSSRGATWIAGVHVFQEMSPMQKIFGVGSDCFAEFAYTIPELVRMFTLQFGGARLTNTHNEWLTTLVNNGIAGLTVYIMMLWVFCMRCIKAAEKNYLLVIPVVCIFSYTMHNMVSFGQILNKPYLFLIIGLGEAMLSSVQREENGSKA